MRGAGEIKPKHKKAAGVGAMRVGKGGSCKGSIVGIHRRLRRLRNDMKRERDVCPLRGEGRHTHDGAGVRAEPAQRIPC